MKIFRLITSQIGVEYFAKLDGNSEICGKGLSSSEAVGDCILEHPEIFGIFDFTCARYPDGHFRVYLNKKRVIYGEGDSKKEAFGTCIRYRPNIFHVIVV